MLTYLFGSENPKMSEYRGSPHRDEILQDGLNFSILLLIIKQNFKIRGNS